MVQQPWELPLGVPMVRCSKRLHLGYTIKEKHMAAEGGATWALLTDCVQGGLSMQCWPC